MSITPGISASQVSVARNDSSPGITSERTSHSALTSPTANTDSPGPVSVLQRASAAAIFIGCCSNISRVWKWPDRLKARPAKIDTHSPRRIARVNPRRSTSLGSRRISHQAEMPATNTAAVSTAPLITWGYAARVVLLVSTARMSVISARPVSGLKIAPTGCCIQELAATMKYADSHVPIAAAQIVARWIFGFSRPQPKIHSPRNVDSRKNATSASIASGAPNTSPTKREYWLQFMPNWNSCTMPVTTPMAKLIRNSFPKNLVRRRSASSPLRYQRVWNQATSIESPMVKGTMMKW